MHKIMTKYATEDQQNQIGELDINLWQRNICEKLLEHFWTNKRQMDLLVKVTFRVTVTELEGLPGAFAVRREQIVW